MSARKRMLASKRGVVGSTRVSRTAELWAVLVSVRSAMKGKPRVTYGITAKLECANSDSRTRPTSTLARCIPSFDSKHGISHRVFRDSIHQAELQGFFRIHPLGTHEH